MNDEDYCPGCAGSYWRRWMNHNPTAPWVVAIAAVVLTVACAIGVLL